MKDWKAGEADAASNAVKKTLPTSEVTTPTGISVGGGEIKLKVYFNCDCKIRDPDRIDCH